LNTLYSPLHSSKEYVCTPLGVNKGENIPSMCHSAPPGAKFTPKMQASHQPANSCCLTLDHCVVHNDICVNIRYASFLGDRNGDEKVFSNTPTKIKGTK
jgi:hypothetical protein